MQQLFLGSAARDWELADDGGKQTERRGIKAMIQQLCGSQARAMWLQSSRWQGRVGRRRLLNITQRKGRIGEESFTLGDWKHVRRRKIERDAEMREWKKREVLEREDIGQENPYWCVSNITCSPTLCMLSCNGWQVNLGWERDNETISRLSCDGEGFSHSILQWALCITVVLYITQWYIGLYDMWYDIFTILAPSWDLTTNTMFSTALTINNELISQQILPVLTTPFLCAIELRCCPKNINDTLVSHSVGLGDMFLHCDEHGHCGLSPHTLSCC